MPILKSLNWRQSLLAFNVAIASLIFGKSLLDPTVGQPRPFELPETVDLVGWSQIDSKALDPFTMPTGEPDHSMVGQSYTFVPDTSLTLDNEATLTDQLPAHINLKDINLTIELRYMLDTNGFIERLLQHHEGFQTMLASVKDDAAITSTSEYEGEVGYYGIFQIEDNAYLSACINPRGESTFSIDQFLHNQSIYDGDPGRFFSVLFGREVWQDKRCLWTHIGLTLGKSSLDGGSGANPINLTPVIKAVWQEWYQTWQPQFPTR